MNLKESSDRLVIIANEFLKLPNLHMLIKQESITFQKLGSQDFWQIANSVLNNGKSAIHPLFNSPEVLSSESDKAKLFAKNFYKNSNLDDSAISLTVFPSTTNLKLYLPRWLKRSYGTLIHHRHLVLIVFQWWF